MSPERTSPPNLAVERKPADVLLVKLSGNWRLPRTLPGLDALHQALQDGASAKTVEFDSSGLESWDSRFLALISKCHDFHSHTRK